MPMLTDPYYEPAGAGRDYQRTFYPQGDPLIGQPARSRALPSVERRRDRAVRIGELAEEIFWTLAAPGGEGPAPLALGRA
jgi:hypothetical protein